MVEISFPGMDKCSFTFSGLEKNVNTLAFFLDLLAKNNMLTNQRSSEGEMFSGWTHYECRSGKIAFTLDYDQYWDWVHFSADTPENARRVANRQKSLIEADTPEKRRLHRMIQR